MDIEKVKRGIESLMVADNLGDVHDALNILRPAVGLPLLEGNFEEGWEKSDWEGLSLGHD